MTDTYFNLHQFVLHPFQKGDSYGAESLDKNGFKSNNTPLFPQFEDYEHLKTLLKEGKKDMAKCYIEKGCRLNKDGRDNTYDGTPLHLAVSLEYPDIVNLLLEKGANVDSKNDCDETPLVLAAIVGNRQIIDMILSKTKPENRCYLNNQGLSHFHIACMQNNVDLAQKFLISGAGINKPVNKESFYWPGFTPLHFAVEFKSIETVKFLLEKGADITIQDSRGLTPLHLAFRKRNRILTDIILSRQYYCASNPIDSEGLSHFHIACAFDKREIIEDFLDKKIEILPCIDSYKRNSHCGFKLAIRNQCINVLEYLLKTDGITLSRDESQIIDCAYEEKNENVINMIISSIEKNMVNIQCSSLLKNSFSEGQVNMYATAESKSTKDNLGHLKRFGVSQYSELHVAVLHRNNDHVNSILEVQRPPIITLMDAQKRTPLHLAFETDQKELVDQLLSLHLELDENPVDSNNLSHFHISCTTKNVSIVEDFIKKGADINMPVNMDSVVWAGCTPLHLAIIHCRSKIVQLLLDNGADFTVKNSIGISPYESAIPFFWDKYINNNDEDYDSWDWLEQILLANEHRKIDNFEDYGITLLHVASVRGDIDMMSRYTSADTINKAISENLIQWCGYTPLHFAVFHNQANAVKLLLDNGADPAIANHLKFVAAHNSYLKCIDDRLLLISNNLYNEFSTSTFHIACQCGNWRGMQHFLAMGANVHERIPHSCDGGSSEDEGKTPLHLAAIAGNAAAVALLLEYGADVNARDCYFNTPLHFSANKEVLEVLLDHGADPEALNCELFSALEESLHKCSEADYMTSVIENGWDINKGRRSLENILNSSNSAVLARHMERLTVLGVHMNESNRKLYASITTKDFAIRLHGLNYKKKCSAELNSMKSKEIDSRTTLYNVLFKSSNEMVKYSKNETFRKIVESKQDLRQKYPIYGYLVTLQYKKGTKRAMLLKEGKKSLSMLMDGWMGDLVFEIILEFMNNHEITFLNYATSGQNLFQ